MKLGAIGDVHAEDEALAEALACFRDFGAEIILCVGDVADGQGDLERCVALLEEAKALCVRGNHDRWLLGRKIRDLPHAHHLDRLSPRAVSFFQALPSTRMLDTPRGTLLLCHGVGDDDMQRLGPDDEGYALTANFALQTLLTQDHAVVVGGHTHRRMVRVFGAMHFVNAGTLARDHEPCFATMEIGAGVDVRFVDLSSKSAK